MAGRLIICVKCRSPNVATRVEPKMTPWFEQVAIDSPERISFIRHCRDCGHRWRETLPEAARLSRVSEQEPK